MIWLTSTTKYHTLATGLLAVIILTVGLISSKSVFAAPNYEINYQGKLTDDNGLTVPDGTYNMRFWLLTSPSIATTSALWTESLTGTNRVQVTNGLFSVMLGSTSPLSSVDFDQTLYLGVEIGDTSGTPAWDGEMSPRKVLGAVPAAFFAETAEDANTVGGVASTSFLRSDQADTASGLITFTAGASSSLLSVSGTATTTNLRVTTNSYLGTVQSGLWQGTAIADTYVADAITVTGGTLGSNTIASGATWTTSGTLTIGDGGDRIDIASDTWDVTNGVITGATYQGSAISSTYLDAAVILSSEIDTSAELAAILGDETGTGRAVFSGSPAFSGTATFSALTATGTASTTNLVVSNTATTTNLRVTGRFRDSANNAGTSGWVLQSTGTSTRWVATTTLGLTSGSSAFLDLSDVSIGSFTANRIPFTNSGGTAIVDSDSFIFDDGTDTLTVGGLTLSDGLTVHTSVSTTTVPNNERNAWTIATSSTGRALFRIDTTIGSESVEIGGGGNDVYIGGVGFPSDLIFEEDSTISGQGTNLLTFGEAGDRINFAVNVGIGSSTPNQKLSVGGNAFIGGNITATGTASTTNLVVSNTATTTNLRVTGRFRDSANNAGTSGWVLQSTGTSTRWVATTTLGFGSALSEDDIEAYIFDGDNTGTLSSGTLALDSLSYTGTLDDTYVADAITVTGGTLGSNTIASGATWTTSGTLTIGDGGDRIDIASDTWDVTNGVITGATYQGSAISSTYLDAAVILSSEIDTSAELAAILGDETGTGRLVFSASPAFSGTATFSALTATGTASFATTTQSGRLTLSGSAANIALGSNWLSGDGGDEGVFVSSDGKVGVGTNDPEQALDVAVSSGSYAAVQLLSGTDTFELGIQDNDNAYLWGYGNQSLLIGTNGAERLRVTSTGNIGIGTSSPNSKFSVAGNSFFGGNLTATGTVLTTAGVRIGANSTNNLIDDSSNGAGSATLYIGNESILASGDIGVSVQGYNANTSFLGSDIGPTELANTNFGDFSCNGDTCSLNDTYLTTVDISTDTNLVAGDGIGLTGDTLFVNAAGGLATTTNGLTTTGVLEDLNTLGAPASDGQIIVATGAGTFAYESGATARASLGAAGLSSPAFNGTATFSNITATGTASTTNLVVSNTATTTNLRVTGRFRDSANNAGTSGWVLQSTGTSTRWVATSSLGISSGGLSSADIDTYSELNTIVADVTLTHNGLIDTSAELAAIVGDETGSGRLVFSTSPAFSGTATFSALTATGTASFATTTQSGRLTLSGAAANIALGSNYLSGDGDDEGIFISSTGNVGIGTTTPNAPLSLYKTGISGAGMYGIRESLNFVNSVESAVLYGDNAYLVNAPTATSTLVGKMLRIEDSSAYGNTVRGIEVQAHRGTNILGENTAISGFGRTFGVRGTTEADAGSVFEPAGIYGQTRGTAQGNAIRGYSASITSATLFSLLQDTSTFTGTGLEMDFGSSGSFSGNFIDLKNAGDSQFVVTNDGSVAIGTSSTLAKLTVEGDVFPGADDTYDLGSSTLRWRDLYLGPASLHIGTDGDEGILSYNTTNNRFEFDVDGDTVIETYIDADGITSSGNSTTTDIRVTGAFRDSANNVGTDGWVLQSTGTSTRWVATSSLGIISGSSFSSADIDTYSELNTIVADVTLTHNGLIDTSAELAAIVGDETGSGRLVFSASPAFSGTATFSSLTATGTVLTSAGVTVGTNSTNNLIDDASNGAGSATLYIGNESILASGDIGVSVQGYNANTSFLSSTINADELASEDFGSFTCNGDTCTLDANSINESMLNVNTATDGYVLQASSTAAGGFAWAVASAGVSTFLDLTDVSVGSYTTNRIPFTNSGATAITDSADFAFDDSTDTLTVGGLTLADGLVTFTGPATTTIADGNAFAFTIATSSTARPLFRIDTSGSGVVSIGSGSGSDVLVGEVGGSTNLVFEEDAIIHGQGENLLTFGQSGDSINFAVNTGFGTTSPSQKLSVAGAIYIASTTPASTNHSLYNLGGSLFFNGSAVGSGSGLVAEDIDTSAELAAILGDETGSGRLIFSGSPAFSGTATFSALTATSTIIGTIIQANTGFMPDANDGAYLGQSGTAFSDLFLASGGIIDWNAGDVTLTHGANTLTFAGATSGYFFNDGDVGIGTGATPDKRLEVFETVGDDQFRISYDATYYTDFQVDSSGDLIIDAQGNDIRLSDENLHVCSGGACDTGSAPAGSGNMVIENILAVGTSTARSGYSTEIYDDLYVGASGATGMGQSTSTFQGDVLIMGKLDVGTIDPIYRIGGVKYATYGVSSIGVKEEAAETLMVSEFNTETGYYEKRIAWNDLSKGSDLWLFHQVTDFGLLWEYLSVSLTAGFDGRVFYKKDVANNALLIQATAPGEVSARFMANRFDWSEWGNLRKDQDVDTTHFELEEKK